MSPGRFTTRTNSCSTAAVRIACRSRPSSPWVLIENVVVLTHPEEHRVKDRDAALVRLFYRKYPAFCRTFENSPQDYKRTQAYLKSEEQKGSVFIIRPKEPIPVGRLSHDPQAIIRAYENGAS